MSPPTFQLWEFGTLYGYDMHYLVLMQLTNNDSSLANLKRNLRHAISSRDVVVHARVYTLQDVLNIQTSAIDLLKRFEGTNDAVDVIVASGTLDVKLNEASPATWREEMEWFESVYNDAKFPTWGNLGGRVISMFEEEFQPEE